MRMVHELSAWEDCVVGRAVRRLRRRVVGHNEGAYAWNSGHACRVLLVLKGDWEVHPHINRLIISYIS